jgi:serine O-acetyltransferase
MNTDSLLRRIKYLWVAPIALLYRSVADETTIDADVQTWLQRTNRPRVSTAQALPDLLTTHTEFRNLYYYRIERSSHALRLAVKLARRMWKPVLSLDLACDDIGPGLFISHGFGTIVTAERIGRNCWIHHQVTIGWSYGQTAKPVIGDDVFIGVGAKILGAITIGDGARIGANAVVVRDVPPGATAVGVPAHISAPNTPPA